MRSARSIWAIVAASALGRPALVVSSWSYRHLPALQSPKANVDAMADALRRTGFDTQTAANLNQVDLLARVHQFMGSIRPGEFVVLYFSGYGSQFDRLNYLLPVSFDSKDGLPVVEKTLSVRSLLSQLTQQKAGGRMLLLDASRTCPGLSKGLASMDAAADTIEAFSAAPDQVAPDPPGGAVDAFTEVLATAFVKPGATPAGAIDAVKREILRRSSNSPAPFTQSGYTGNLVLAPLPPPPTIASFAASQPAIHRGESVNLQWNVTGDAPKIAIDPAIGAVPGSGGRSVQPSQTTTYRLTAEGAGGTKTASVTVTVSEPTPAPKPVPPEPPTPPSLYAAPPPAGKSSTDLEEAYREFKAGHWQNAIAAFNRSLARDPNAEDFSERGICYFNLHDYKKALADFNAAIEKNGNAASAYFNRAATEQRLDQCAPAVKDFDRALQLNPAEPVYLNRAECHAKLGEPQAAADDYTHAIDAGSKSPDVFRERGRAYIRLAQYREAVKDLTVAIQADTDDIDSLENRASAEKSAGDAGASEEDARRVRELTELRQVFSAAQQAGLKFFVGDAQTKPPRYETHFAAGEPGPIQRELDLYLRAAPSFRVNLTLHEIWYRPDGSLDHRADIRTFIDAGVHNWRQLAPWSPAAGAKSPAGTYRVEIYGLGIRIGTGKVDITK